MPQTGNIIILFRFNAVLSSPNGEMTGESKREREREKHSKERRQWVRCVWCTMIQSSVQFSFLILFFFRRSQRAVVSKQSITITTTIIIIYKIAATRCLCLVYEYFIANRREPHNLNCNFTFSFCKLHYNSVKNECILFDLISPLYFALSNLLNPFVFLNAKIATHRLFFILIGLRDWRFIFFD